MLHSNIIK